jgi:transposase
MIDYELFCKIKKLAEQDGLKPAQIAGALGLDIRTVAKWLAQKRFTQRQSVPRSSKLDIYKNDIIRMLDSHPYSAVQIFQRLREMGFTGGYTIVKEYIRLVRPKRSPAFLTLSFAPGECAQVDWGEFGSVNVGNTRRKLSFFVMVLCYSRMIYVEFTVSQTMEHFLACHQHAFEFFGGIPKKLMIDNLKSAVLFRFTGKSPVFNPKYLDFADHYGFAIAPCNVGKGNEKGRVENGVGYVKKNFLSGLDIPDFAAIHPAAFLWRDTIANVRIHNTTHEKPVDLFPKDKSCLLPLPAFPFDIGTVSQVRASSQFRVTLDTNRYSVPAEYAGVRLTLKAYPDRLCMYLKDNLIARHLRSYDRHQDFEHPDHPKELLAQRKKARDQQLFIQFLKLSPKAEAYYQNLEQRRLNPRHHVQKIVALSEIYPKEAVSRAMEDAFTFQAFSSEYIANILEQRSRHQEEPGALSLTRKQDLLDLTLKIPDLNIYKIK